MLPQVHAHFLCTAAEHNNSIGTAANPQTLLDAADATCKFWTVALNTLLDTWHNVISMPTISLTLRSIRTNPPSKISKTSLIPLICTSFNFLCISLLPKFSNTRRRTDSEQCRVQTNDQPSFQLKNLSAPSISLLHFLLFLSLPPSLWLPWFLSPCSVSDAAKNPHWGSNSTLGFERVD